MKHSSECDLQIRMNDSHPVSQSVSQSLSVIHSACTFIHTNVKPQKRQSRPSSIVLNRKTGFHSPAHTALCMQFVVPPAFWSIAKRRGKGQSFPLHTAGGRQHAISEKLFEFDWSERGKGNRVEQNSIA